MADLVFYLFCELFVQFVKAAFRLCARASQNRFVWRACLRTWSTRARNAARSPARTTLDVLDCTDYRDRNHLVPIRLIGFEGEIATPKPASSETAA